MRIQWHIKRMYFLFFLFLLSSVSANAASPLDLLKEIFENGAYTIRYEVQDSMVQDMQRKYSQDTLFENDLALGNADNLNSKHFITVRGKTAYGEHVTLWGGQNISICYLQREDQVYEFMYTNGRYLTKSGGKAIAARPMSDRKKAEIYGYEFLNSLKPIFPNLFRAENDVFYTFRPAGEGTDKEGRTYYDYEADFSGKGGNYFVYRYTFQGNTLTKISLAAHYVYQGKAHNSRTIFYIKEISPTADTSRLSLPKGLIALD